MTKQEIWNQLCDRHPEFKDPEFVVKQRARGLKALLDQAYDNGVENGKTTKPTTEEDLISKLFGK